MITTFKPSKPDRPRTHCSKQDKSMKKRIMLMIKTPKEASVLIAFQKPTAIWDIKMEEVPQLAVQDLKTTCSKKVEYQHSTHRNNRILHIYCMSFTTWTAHKGCLKPWFQYQALCEGPAQTPNSGLRHTSFRGRCRKAVFGVWAPRYDKTSR